MRGGALPPREQSRAFSEVLRPPAGTAQCICVPSGRTSGDCRRWRRPGDSAMRPRERRVVSARPRVGPSAHSARRTRCARQCDENVRVANKFERDGVPWHHFFVGARTITSQLDHTPLRHRVTGGHRQRRPRAGACDPVGREQPQREYTRPGGPNALARIHTIHPRDQARRPPRRAYVAPSSPASCRSRGCASLPPGGPQPARASRQGGAQSAAPVAAHSPSPAA